jgi:hypothetical protein
MVIQKEPALKMTAPTIFKSAPTVATQSPLVLSGPSQAVKRAEPWENWRPLTMEDIRCKEWNKDEIVVQEQPMYFPSNNLNYEFHGKELIIVLNRISALFRKLSIQANLRNSPLSAYLQTCENIEFYLVFFTERSSRRRDATVDPSSRKMFMSVQRHKGDQMIANHYLNEIVEAAKGVGLEMDVEQERPKRILPLNRISPDPKELLAVERVIERSMQSQSDPAVSGIMKSSVFFKPSSPEETSRSVVETLYSFTQQVKRLDSRRNFLECLLVMTDVRRTLSSSAIPSALVVVCGSAPDMMKEAGEIQGFLLRILQNDGFPGDEEMFEGIPVTPDLDNDMEIKPYFPEETELPNKYPPFFVEYLSELKHLALQVLVQSLEVIFCFHEKIADDGWDIQEMGSCLLDRASQVSGGKDFMMFLLGFVERVELKLSNGYLACKALRLLAMASSGLKDRLKADENAWSCIANAHRIGQESHTLLEEESYQLIQSIRQ